MKKTFKRISAFLLAVISAFVLFPFNTVKASTQNTWNNLIDWYRTALGALYIDNGSVNGMTRDELYTRLYDTELKYPIRGELVTFRPSDRFTNDREWVDACNGNLPSSSPAYDDFRDFNIGECLKESGFIEDTGSGYKVGSAPTLSNSTNAKNPLDGVEVKTNFGDFHTDYDSQGLYYFNQIRANLSSNCDNYIILVQNLNNGSSTYVKSIFYGFSNYDFIYFIESTPGSINTNFSGYYNNKWFSYSNWYSCDLQEIPNTSNNMYLYLPHTKNYSGYPELFVLNHNDISLDNNIVVSDGYKANYVSSDYSIFSTMPIIIGSNETSVRKYYYWKNGTPSGGFFSTQNNNNIYTYDVVNNNNWNNAYNNYITDVSNYYSTTSNITNEQITQYIDQSTTINNITNNYITNVVNPDNPDNPDNPSGGGVISNSWLERIYEKLEYIIDILLGRHDPESDTTIYTDNSIKNDVVYYPFSDLFPDVPESDFLPELTTLDIPLISSKMNNVLSRAMPFCYMWQLGTVAEALSAPPRAPTYDIPFKIDRLNIDEEVSIDLSNNSWSVLHSIWITLFMITFLVALFYMTYRFIMLINSLF